MSDAVPVLAHTARRLAYAGAYGKPKKWMFRVLPAAIAKHIGRIAKQ